MKKKLTKAEEEIMHILWTKKRAVLKSIIDSLPSPKPSTTVASVIKVLETKGFVQHHTYGRTHEYYPTIDKETYRKGITHNLLLKYFDGSFKQLASFFVSENKITKAELEELLKDLDDDKTIP